ncbi:hypothetical protein J2S40_004507 [Nocardioides luteus]|uniref:DUF2190 domain-containing protein n=1 Tax=Nocardioides luteus TaxID=1844 RepID=A0ABQ5SRT8_9ACTN|nr:capsid cement protein [Nocardioides luteus]MDR7313449.1 hypothetical protein [Nocardioides luteus]GGR60949.1 hypothetical protein GCM10010197_30130 [Nocardioides luteus]GLJ66514.1 hypothetical protein GCM10017579_05500 [Nocardioides luteus]
MTVYRPRQTVGNTPLTSGLLPLRYTTSAAVVGGRMVAVSGDGTVAHAPADSASVVGVAGSDAGAGQAVDVWPIEGCEHELEASAGISAGAGVVTDTGGLVKTATVATAAAAGTLVGVAVTTAAGAPLKLRVHGRR